ncbi:TlpA disulfide reductase family protein [Pedobacter aquatilis]|uniref:TlpA disulfide reductase family protein n=1 Tax=Pedobacter aquatilis TaxID=351343 RepID=UPI00292D5D6A|nr:TlpA disulfide reductase family protein [Pedobacter aquatilis]
MKITITLCIIGLLKIAAYSQTKPAYRVQGTVTGLTDGTWLYLRTSSPDRRIDSCQVQGGKFSMCGHIDAKALRVYLHTERYSNYLSFWLENKAINMRLTAGAFKRGTVTGSATEDENRKLTALTGLFSQLSDSLGRVLEGTQDSLKRRTLIQQIREADLRSQQVEQSWVHDHPGSILSANILGIYASTWGKTITQSLYKGLSKDNRKSPDGRNIREYLELNQSVKIGGHYADFEQQNPQGKTIRLSEFKGRYILLDFWASWCGPCREENPRLVKTYQRFKAKGLTIIGISLDENRTEWVKAIEKDQLNWENLSDLRGDKNRAALIYGVHAIPSNYLIDNKGIIIATNLRGIALENQLEKLMP